MGAIVCASISLPSQGSPVHVHVHVPVHEDRFTDVAPRFLVSDSIRILVNVNGYRFAVNVYGLTVNASGLRTREPNAKPGGLAETAAGTNARPSLANPQRRRLNRLPAF